MNNLMEEWKKMQMVYQQRYATFLKNYCEDNSNVDAHGHAMECSYILTNIFGLTSKEIIQLEKNNFAGLLDSDLDD